MRLFLASEGKHPETIAKLKSFIPEPLENKKITFIPTAANGEFYGAWKGWSSPKIVSELGGRFKIVELEDVKFKDVIKEIEDSDIIWMNGGMSAYLLYWIRRTKLDKALYEMLKRGVVYVGSSAGTMICSKTQYSSEWYIGEEEPGASLIPGLGLVDFEIYPHFQDELRPEIERKWTKGKLYLLKDGEVITIVDDKIEVLGEERIIEK
jgi:dipeptidase E